MDRYNELLELIKKYEKDFQKFYNKGNKAAGIRLRKHMQEVRKFAKSIRDEVQRMNIENEKQTAE